jgi:beta-glucanase (GH16 family)
MMIRITCIVLALVLALCACEEKAMATDNSVFDDFDGPAGAPPNSKIWGYDLGGGWGYGNELQEYTNSSDNVRLDGQGHLVIQALKTPTGYTSGRLVTRQKLNIRYGKLSARIKFPAGQGIWPAFWTLGSNIDSLGWPRCGEIDIMELANVGTTYQVALHGPQGDSDYLAGAGIVRSGPIADLTDDFHDYWLSWRPNAITVGVDDVTLAVFTPASLPPGAEWVFSQPMYAVLNIAVGGKLPGPPTDETPFPATMLVDWFRFTPDS